MSDRRQRPRRPNVERGGHCHTSASVFAAIDFRQRPDLYRIGKGEQGVLLVEPYKGKLLPHWRFKTVAEAKKSSAKIYSMFLAYLKSGDFPGADMARKFLQMGWTRARRYANHKGGLKYDKASGKKLPRTEDTEKAATAAVFEQRKKPPADVPGGAGQQHDWPIRVLRFKWRHRLRYDLAWQGRCYADSLCGGILPLAGSQHRLGGEGRTWGC